MRLDVKRVIEVNLIAQCFKAHILLEASWVEPEMAAVDLKEHPWDADADTAALQKVGKLKLVGQEQLVGQEKGFFAPRLSLRNAVETSDEQMWYVIYENKTDSAAGPIVCLRWEATATFQEVFELRLFPLDTQELSIELLTGHETVGLAVSYTHLTLPTKA